MTPENTNKFILKSEKLGTMEQSMCHMDSLVAEQFYNQQKCKLTKKMGDIKEKLNKNII